VPYTLVFDGVILKQFKKAGKNMHIKNILKKMLDKIEANGPEAGEIVDPQLSIYEVKSMHPPIRLYFKHSLVANEIYVFEYEMKTSPQKQQRTIDKLKAKISKP